MKTIKVFEREKVFYGGDHVLSKEHFDKLVKFNDQNDQKYFSVIHRGVKFNQYVGVIKVGNVLIEIVPKLDNVENNSNHNYWQSVLLNMLRVCRILSPSAPTDADLRLRNNSILDLYFDLFISEVEYLLRRGLIKRYIRRTENKKAVKGKITFSDHIKKNYVHKERFYVTYKEYSYNHLINQILLKTLTVIEKVSGSASLKGRISKLKFSLPALDDIAISKKLFNYIGFDRKNDKYREALQIAELLLLNYSPDIKSGQNDVLALLFDMEMLFEEYVFRRLKKLSREHDFSVLRQQSKTFWRSKTIRPDIVLKHKNRVVVLDTKWKSLSTINPTVDDLRQMYVYNQYFGSDLSVLIYPKASELNKVHDPFKDPAELFRFDGHSVDHGCMLYFLPLASESGLNLEASSELIDVVLN
jgi:5-methylcytosine-specific restriction enzyme subunit McrC